MRLVRSTITAVLTAITATALLVAPNAQAQNLFEGGRLGGLSSQLVPAGSSFFGEELPEVSTPVDVNRYAGIWYQVAAIPQPFTLQCVRDVTAQYGVIDATTISVQNSCGTLLGSDSRIEGTATARSGASLRVNFPGVPFQNPDGRVNYRITYLDEAYSLAIVGDPARLSGFVLSRNKALTGEQWSEVRRIVENRGYNACTFLTVPMTGGRGDVVPLCWL